MKITVFRGAPRHILTPSESEHFKFLRDDDVNIDFLPPAAQVWVDGEEDVRVIETAGEHEVIAVLTGLVSLLRDAHASLTVAGLPLTPLMGVINNLPTGTGLQPVEVRDLQVLGPATPTNLRLESA